MITTVPQAFVPAAFFHWEGFCYMAMIQVTGLTFGYEDSLDLVFQNASFQIDTSWTAPLSRHYRCTKRFFLFSFSRTRPSSNDLFRYRRVGSRPGTMAASAGTIPFRNRG